MEFQQEKQYLISITNDVNIVVHCTYKYYNWLLMNIFEDKSMYVKYILFTINRKHKEDEVEN